MHDIEPTTAPTTLPIHPTNSSNNWRNMVAHCPIVVNGTQHSIVVFQERGILYNKQVLQPGEAVGMTRFQTGGLITPYYVHAVIGDERALPTRIQSVKNLVKVTAIPAAFIAGALTAAVGAGMMLGPAAALAPLVSGLVINGIVVDSAALAAGGIVASRAGMVTAFLLKHHPDKFMGKTGRLRPGKQYLVVTGGLSDGPVKIESKSKREFRKLDIPAIKAPMNTLHDKIKYYLPGADKSAKEDPQLIIEATEETNKVALH
jgi:hypothetical protein